MNNLLRLTCYRICCGTVARSEDQRTSGILEDLFSVNRYQRKIRREWSNFKGDGTDPTAEQTKQFKPEYGKSRTG